MSLPFQFSCMHAASKITCRLTYTPCLPCMPYTMCNLRAEIPTGSDLCSQATCIHTWLPWLGRWSHAHTLWAVRLTYCLSVQLNGDIPEQKGGRFAPPLSVPQLKEALEKAAYDPRIRGIHLKIGSVSAGWAKLQVSQSLWRQHMTSMQLAGG